MGGQRGSAEKRRRRKAKGKNFKPEKEIKMENNGFNVDAMDLK
jgi:hypothetical protein